jgi:hypothetical protein
MAANSGVTAVTATLGAGVADTFALTGLTDEVLITNHGNIAGVAYFRLDGTAAVGAAANNGVILGGQQRRVRAGAAGAVKTISIISAAALTITVEAA